MSDKKNRSALPPPSETERPLATSPASAQPPRAPAPNAPAVSGAVASAPPVPSSAAPVPAADAPSLTTQSERAEPSKAAPSRTDTSAAAFEPSTSASRPGPSKASRGPVASAAPSTAPNLRALLGEAQKTFGQGAIQLLDQKPTQHFASFPSGSRALDAALGIGGYPRGRIIEIYGPESSGKTTLTLHAIAEVQKRGGVAAFIDAEHAFDVRYARAIGVDPASLLVSQPDSGEQGLEIAHFLTKSGGIDLIVIDSVAALVPRAEIEGDMGDPHMGLQARLMSQALRKLTAISNKQNTTFIFINQLRQKIGVVMGNPETTTGGNALKFYASVRLDVRRTGKVTVGEEAVGNRTRVKVVKNKCAQPFTEAEFDIRWGTGIDAASDLLETAAAAGVVQKNGAHYAFGGHALGHGKEKTREALLESETLRDQIGAQLRALSAA